MADGRMLKKAISTSRRLADLKTDSARMLYTWIIPHLDVEGRFYADPAMIKGSVVPRVKSFSENKISECLQDMADVGLIIIYGVDGDKYLQLRKFEDHQNIKKDREALSKIPPPNDNPEENSRVTQENSGVTQELIQSSTAQDKIREDKISEVKLREGGKPFLPPSLEDVANYFQEKGFREDSARKAFEYYQIADWHDSTGKKIKNWKQKMIAVWFKDENKTQANSDKSSPTTKIPDLIPFPDDDKLQETLLIARELRSRKHIK